MERFNLILAVIENDLLQKPLTAFSSSTIAIINIVLGTVMGLASIGIIIYMLILIAKRNDTDPAVAEVAEKKLKKVVISLILVVVVFSAGFGVVNGILSEIGKTGFEVEISLRQLGAIECNVSYLGTENIIAQAPAIVCGARQVLG